MGWKARSPRDAQASNSEFINVDLDLNGPCDMQRLIAALGPVHAIAEPGPKGCAPFYILEVDAVGLGLEATIGSFLHRVEQLDEQERAAWDQCSLRRFNVGIQAGLDPTAAMFTLPAELLARVALAGAEVVLTLYGARRTLSEAETP